MHELNPWEDELDFAIWATKKVPGDLPIGETVETTGDYVWEIAKEAAKTERKKIIKLLEVLNVIRRDALGDLVAFNTDGTEVIYLEGLEK
jgi:hypothetical protein